MSGARGFTLVETLVAVFVVAMTIVLFAAALNTFRLTRTSAHKYIALAIAQNELEALRGGGYAALPAGGSFSDPLLSSLPGNATDTISVSSFNAKTKRVIVSVSWSEPGSSGDTVSLATLITSVGGL